MLAIASIPGYGSKHGQQRGFASTWRPGRCSARSPGLGPRRSSDELVSAGEVQRGQAQQWVDDLVERSRKASEDLIHLVRTEVSNQLAALGVDPEDLAKQVADILQHSAGRGAQGHQ